MSTIKSKKDVCQIYYIGIDETILEKMNDMMTIEYLHKDSRLIINDDFHIFADDKNIDAVMHNYELEFKQTLEEWWVLNGAPGRYYSEVDGVIDHSNLASAREISNKCVDVLNKMNGEELESADFDDMYLKCAKKVIIDNLRREADRLEKEWFK